MKTVKEKIERMDLTMARRPKGNYEAYIGLVFEENSVRESTHQLSRLQVTTMSSASSVFNLFSVHTLKRKPAISNPFSLKSIFEKVSFLDGLVWMIDQSGEI